jgi:hypothetical protein
MNENGPIRRRNQQELAIGMTPIIMPSSLEYQARHLDFWDEGNTTRFVWQFIEEGDTENF